ncbi:DUF4097 family beta strand repeat-containing protein [Streptosporangium soli]|nr:DUF4097 domain-containing protein [Streptosporangium sp. KLBMP 9127]
MMKKITAVAAALAAAGALTSCGIDLAAEERHDSRDFAFSGDQLTIRPGVQVHVVAGSGPGLKVERWLRGKAAQDGNATWSLREGRLVLTADCNMIIGDCGARYLVRVPGTPNVIVEGGQDDVRLTGLAGNLVIATRSGNIRVEKPAGDVRLRSTDGSLVLTGGRSASVTARSGSGDVDLFFVAPPSKVRALSAHGRVTALLPEVKGSYRIDASTRHGTRDSEVRHAPGSKRTIVIRSDNDDVRLRTTEPAGH